MDLENDEQEQLAKKIREFTSSTRPRNLNKRKKNKVFKIVHWHFSREEKWFLMSLGVRYLHCFLQNQNN